MPSAGSRGHERTQRKSITAAQMDVSQQAGKGLWANLVRGFKLYVFRLTVCVSFFFLGEEKPVR